MTNQNDKCREAVNKWAKSKRKRMPWADYGFIEPNTDMRNAFIDGWKARSRPHPIYE